ncbi:hypothetical protein [Wolbachia endosymbiont (group A) of Bombylius major]|uniref:hypothetical protein n=1 Tax=Wolbachia endosymbiont (group A) of Bombylius major TaxID=2953988 RepID=UPI00223187CF|nr:hypothetical protein [Wolbachia endosymbiont (group A) of Bombylius major]
MKSGNFGKTNRFTIKEGTGYSKAIWFAYKNQTDENSGIFRKAWAGVMSPVYGTANYAYHHPYKTFAACVVIAAAISLTAAYFMSPAYAAFVGTVGTKAATLVSPAITAVSAFLVAHPLVASLIVVAAVVALIVAPVYAHKNISKTTSQIDEVKEVFSNCEKDGDKLAMSGDKIKVNNGDPLTHLTKIAKVIGLLPKEAETITK